MTNDTETTIREEVEWFKQAADGGVIMSGIGNALTGQSDLAETLERARNSEITTTEDVDPSNLPDDASVDDVVDIERSIELMDALTGRKLEEITLRQYDEGVDGKEAEQKGAEGGSLGLLALGAKITGDASGAVFDIGNGKKALFLNRRRRQPGAFSVRYGSFNGSLDIYIVDDVREHIRDELYSDRWRLPEDVKSDSDNAGEASA